MLEKFLELLLSAKSGVIAGVFLVGTTGALVTATVQNGVTTITITQASPSPTGSASPSPTGAVTISPATNVAQSGTSSASPSPCADNAHAMADAVETVNRAYSQYHTDLAHFRKDGRTEAARSIVEKAQELLQEIRHDAVEAIHDTNTCADRDDDEDADTDEDNDEDNDEDEDSSGTNTNTATTFTGTDPKAIADQAVAAMKVVFDTAVADLQKATATPSTHRSEATPRTERTRRPEPTAKPESHEEDRD